MADKRFMKRAIELSRLGMDCGDGGPFGAVIVRDGQIVGEGWNHVLSSFDPTAHAEVVAIRAAAHHLQSIDLSGCTLYTSAEPCPMCLGATYWSRIECVFFGNSREDTAALGFEDAQLYQEFSRPITRQALTCCQLLRDEAQTVFQQWRTQWEPTSTLMVKQYPWPALATLSCETCFP